MHQYWAEPAFGFDEDPVAHAEAIRPNHAAARFRRQSMSEIRPVIAASWRRLQRLGVNQSSPAPRIDEDAVSQDLDWLGSLYSTAPRDLATIVRDAFAPALANSQLVGVLALRDSHVALRYGSRSAIARADDLGMIPGAVWSEEGVGTNAIGITARTGRPSQIHGPEHWCVEQHAWSCSAAPIRDPATGALVGVLDVSGPVSQSHPAVLGLVQAVAGQAELMLKDHHRNHLETLRARHLPEMWRSTDPWVLCDRTGWVLGSRGIEVPRRLDLPDVDDGLTRYVPHVGSAVMHINNAVVTILPAADQAALEYELNPVTNELVVYRGDHSFAARVSTRHAQLIRCLESCPEPATVEDLAQAVWGSPDISPVTVRAEISRLRRRFGALISESPYRLLGTRRGEGAARD